MSNTNENARHPDSTFKTKYPYNQATVTRSGHEFHINDTLDNESLRVSHTTGTYVEIEKTGRWVNVITEKCYQYIMSTLTQTIDSHVDIKVGGTHMLNVDKSSYENVNKDKHIGIGENLIDAVGGVRQIHTEKDREESVNGSSRKTIRHDEHKNVERNKITNIKGIKQDILSDDWFVTSSASVDMYVDGDFRIACRNFIVNARDTVTITTATGPITITAAGIVYVNGVQIRLNG